MLNFISKNKILLHTFALSTLISTTYVLAMNENIEEIKEKKKLEELSKEIKEAKNPIILKQMLKDNIMSFYNWEKSLKYIVSVIKDTKLKEDVRLKKVKLLTNKLLKNINTLSIKDPGLILNQPIRYKNATATLFGHAVMGPKNKGGNPDILKLLLGLGSNQNELLEFNDTLKITYDSGYGDFQTVDGGQYTFIGTPLAWIITHLRRISFGSIMSSGVITKKDATLAINLIQELLNPDNKIQTDTNAQFAIESNNQKFADLKLRKIEGKYAYVGTPLSFLLNPKGMHRERFLADIQLITLLLHYKDSKTGKLITNINNDNNFMNLIDFAYLFDAERNSSYAIPLKKLIKYCLINHWDEIDFSKKKQKGR